LTKIALTVGDSPLFSLFIVVIGAELSHSGLGITRIGAVIENVHFAWFLLIIALLNANIDFSLQVFGELALTAESTEIFGTLFNDALFASKNLAAVAKSIIGSFRINALLVINLIVVDDQLGEN